MYRLVYRPGELYARRGVWAELGKISCAITKLMETSTNSTACTLYVIGHRHGTCVDEPPGIPQTPRERSERDAERLVLRVYSLYKSVTACCMRSSATPVCEGCPPASALRVGMELKGPWLGGPDERVLA